MILELRNNLHEGAKTENRTSNDAPVVSLDDWSEANNGPALTILEFFDLLARATVYLPGATPTATGKLPSLVFKTRPLLVSMSTTSLMLI